MSPPPLRSLATLSWTALACLCTLLLATPAVHAEKAAPEVSGKLYTCNPGPWGVLHYFYIYLEAPDALIEHFPAPNSVPRWCFPDWSMDQVRALLDKAGLSPTLQTTLLDPKRTVLQDKILCIFPPLPLLESLTPDQRSVIYSELAKYDINEFHQNPVFINSDDVDEWLRGTELRKEIVAKIHRYTYRRGEALAFSDLSAVMNYLRDEKEARYFFKIMTRTRALMARLEVRKGTDTKALAEYWTGHNRLKDILPLLQSVMETDGIDDLPVAHLLPMIPRQYLYTYPSLDAALEGRMPDCHWTSLNFFRAKPKEYYRDTRLAADCVLQTYIKVDPPYQFGDVLMFMDQATGVAYHSCVYVADDIVYTKNGENAVAPWLLSKLNDVKRIYFAGPSGVIQGFRIKDLSN